LKLLRPYFERAQQFSGWDFSDINVQWLEPGPTWNYEQLVREISRTASTVVDMGTGGGEFLAKVRNSLPDRVIATEEWKLNVPIAKGRLTPLGVDVVESRSRQLPFKDAAFDLVLNRHEELEPAEIARVMSPRGRVVTQQVGRDNWKEVRKHFPRMADPGDHRGEYAYGFRAAGLNVTTNLQYDFKVAYATLGDFVYMLAVTPWTVPGLDPEGDIDSLLSLDAECHTKDGLVLTESRFLLVAEKPG
jgi:SAM-dependent methyltransferase